MKISTAAGSGGIGSVKYDYTFADNILTLSFSGLPTGYTSIPTLALTTHRLDAFNITVNATNSAYEVMYDGNEILVCVKPNSGYYVTNVNIDGGNNEDIVYYRGSLRNVGNAYTIDYTASDTSSMVVFTILFLEGDITFNISTTTSAPVLKQASGGIDDVAVVATIGGSAEIVGDSFDELVEGDTITVVARQKLNGYQFDGWYVDGVLVSTGLSARLAYDDTIKGKIIVAKFSLIDANVNIETDNNAELV